MKKLKRLIVATEILGLAAFVVMGFGMLALTDIFHGEVDVRLEWWMVRITFLVWIIFIVLVLFTIRQMRHAIHIENK